MSNNKEWTNCINKTKGCENNCRIFGTGECPVELNTNAMFAFNYNQNEKAISLLEKAIIIEPAFGDAYNNLASAYGSIRQITASLRNAALCYQTGYRKEYVFKNLAISLNNLGKQEDAKSIIYDYKNTFNKGDLDYILNLINKYPNFLITNNKIIRMLYSHFNQDISPVTDKEIEYLSNRYRELVEYVNYYVNETCDGDDDAILKENLYCSYCFGFYACMHEDTNIEDYSICNPINKSIIDKIQEEVLSEYQKYDPYFSNEKLKQMLMDFHNKLLGDAKLPDIYLFAQYREELMGIFSFGYLSTKY